MQVETRVARAPRAHSAFAGYLMTWVAVAAVGLGYLGVAASRPELLGAILPLADGPQEQALSGRTAADLAEEIVVLRKYVHDLQHEVAATRSALNDQVTASEALVQRLAAAEERLPPVREIRSEMIMGRPPAQRVPARAPAATAPAAAAPHAPAPASAPEQIGRGASVSLGSVKVLNAGVETGITTGSLPAAATAAAATAAPAGPAEKSAAAPAGGAPRGIEIANGDSLETLRSRWGELANGNPDVLKDLAPRYRLSADGRQSPFTLLAGPFPTTAEATRTCAALRSKGVTCRVGDYAGSSF